MTEATFVSRAFHRGVAASLWLPARAASLNPFGPIFGKELRVTSRKKRSYAFAWDTWACCCFRC